MAYYIAHLCEIKILDAVISTFGGGLFKQKDAQMISM